METALQKELRIAADELVSGVRLHRYHRVVVAGLPRFLKTNDAGHADIFVAEADGLAALRDGGIAAPRPLVHGTAGQRAYLLLDYLSLGGKPDFGALGRMLADLHRRPGPRFGWHRDNYIGLSPQQNGWCDDWGEFWRERRLRPQAERAGVRIDLDRIELHQPQPSLLHGDLWSGNAGFTPEGPVVFDPAVYYGDREADLAMTELFGGFPEGFYRAYEEAFPLDAGYEERKHLYNLYHLLNHLNIFGGGYLGQVKATLRLLGL